MVGCAERIWEAGRALSDENVGPTPPNLYPFTLSTNQSELDISNARAGEWNADLAIGKVAFASSVAEDKVEEFGPYFVIDGSSKTQWKSKSSSGSHWIVIDLDQSYSIGRVEIDWGESHTTLPYEYTIKVSDDNENWTVANLPGENKRFVQVSVAGVSVAEIKDIQVFGTEKSDGKWQVQTID